jgi:hypothetical protein
MALQHDGIYDELITDINRSFYTIVRDRIGWSPLQECVAMLIDNWADECFDHAVELFIRDLALCVLCGDWSTAHKQHLREQLRWRMRQAQVLESLANLSNRDRGDILVTLKALKVPVSIEVEKMLSVLSPPLSHTP